MGANNQMARFHYLNDWCKDKAIGLRIVAKVAAFSPEDTEWGFDRLYHRDFPNIFPVPSNPDIWHACYYRGKQIFECFLSMMFHNDQHLIQRIKQYYHDWRFASTLSPDVLRETLTQTLTQMTQSDLSFTIARGYYFWRTIERHIDCLLFDREANEKPPEIIYKGLATPDIQFFVRVYCPCFMAYKTTPIKLLEEAKQPDFKAALPALKKLLPLDPALANVEPFKTIIHQFRHDPAHAHDFHLITSALQSRPFPRLRLAKIRANGAALVSVVAKGLRIRLTKKELWKLEEAVARDRGLDKKRFDQRTFDDYRKPIEREERELLAMIPRGTFQSSQMSQ